MRLFTTWLSVTIGMGIGSYLWSDSNWFHDWYFEVAGATIMALWVWAGYGTLALRGPSC